MGSSERLSLKDALTPFSAIMQADLEGLLKSKITYGWLTAAVVAVAILGCVGVGLFPQTLAPLAVRLAETYTFLVP